MIAFKQSKKQNMAEESQMKDKKRLRPPYASSGQADGIIGLFRRITPKKIDSKFVAENKIATASNAFTVVDTVKWLGITNEEGIVAENIANKLRLVGEEKEVFIKSLIEKSYHILFERINLNEAKKDDVINFFVNEYRYGTAQAKYAAQLFLHLCQKYRIPISEELKKKTHTGKKISTKENKFRGNKKLLLPKAPEKLFSINKGEVILSINSKELNASLKANSKKELEELYNNEFKSLIEVAKLLFPKEKEVEK